MNDLPEPAPPREEFVPRRSVKVPFILLAALTTAIGTGVALLRRASASTNSVALSASAKGVSATRARAATFRESRRYVGTLESWLQAKVGPQLVSGYVSSVLVRPGDIIKAGHIVATLDCRNSSAANQAVLLQAHALEARQRALASETARFQSLFDGGFVSPNEVEQRQARTSAEGAELAAVQAQSLGKRLEVNDCVLRAPFDGEVATRAVDPGAYVRPGTTIVSVVDRHLLRLVTDVPETDFAAVAPKTHVRFRLLANGLESQGVISRRSPAADDSTRTVRFEVDIDPSTRDLPVGTTAEIRLDVGQPHDALKIPLVAAKVRGNRASVFVVEGKLARKVEVAVLGEDGGSLYVEGAMKPDTLVVVEGRSQLSSGDAVVVKEVDAAEPTEAP